MQTIKLNFDAVMQQLDDIKHALGALNLPGPSAGSLGQNQLEFTATYLEREARIHKSMTEYIQVVQKNIEDTRANVELLKKQDEAIVNK
ncbi:hypothetical protein JOC77_001374 [Peribacillus deserti]|uniref:YwqI/YxiC family protein n=1 Tax=Peribacillus deserti TaxID=673318 RepID=A0ABS2QGL7_9BACI|nr:YwqI/YxiC family protein [Peribacillus deserti]MBM7691964.1 hypothetical protein [Peribacillus deserti]